MNSTNRQTDILSETERATAGYCFLPLFRLLALRRTSRRFTRANCKLAVVKAIAAFSLVIRAFRKTWGLSPPPPPEFFIPHILI